MKKLKIDIVSDVMCPWCVIGYRALAQALENLDSEVEAELHWQPFELAPEMPPEGEDLAEHLQRKYRMTAEQGVANRAMITERAAALGFTMNFFEGMKKYNTFDAHRLLHWAGEEGKQTELKQALFKHYFTDGGDPSDKADLLTVAASVGLDVGRAQDVLDSGLYGQHVRAMQAHYHNMGVQSVPTFVINERYLITGGQPVEQFEQALRQIALKENQ
ncbi:DsbA family oxidoreductase [Ferrimonas marina]|uniref:Predicted dithiol-disulfide isomerase, DsbA family n=1 Tax=Ferrimonas marina TaxID=299255 RepID=A0A1M5YRZ9_9GAMM|nr:DsbA family oxidoreductase [Ferrimonas marina]SHI14624.1 Predicted dithiol-disulfide isomerase, DsbA family [Ferrimonas marina]